MADQCRPHRRGLVVATAVIGAVGLAGCGGVPSSGSVHVGNAVAPATVGQSQENIRVLPPRPQPGMSQFSLVRAFLGATVDSDGDYSAARAYLARGTSWNTSAGITTYNQGATVLRHAGSRLVQVSTAEVGTITPRGDYLTSPGNVVRDFSLVRQDGQWRISRLPAGILLSTDDAQHVLQTETLYYLNPSGNALVPEQILVPQTQLGLPTTLVRALVSGPPPLLASAVHTAVPAGTRLLGNVPVTSDGVAEVDLAGVPPQLTALSLVRLLAQLGWTLKDLDVRAVQLLVDGEPLIVPGFSTLQSPSKAYDPNLEPAQHGLLYVRGGRVHGIGETVPAALAHRFGLSAPAISADGTAVAALSRHGVRQQLLVGAATDAVSRRLTASQITAPSFDPSGDVVVVAGTGTGSRIIKLSGGGNTERISAPASLLAAGITDLAISPDGTRLAMVVGARGPRSLMVGLIRTHRGQQQLVGVRQVIGADSHVRGLAWEGAGQIITTMIGSDGKRVVISTDTIGYAVRELSSTRLPGRPVQVADAPGERPYAVAGGRLYRLLGGRWQPVSPGVDPSYAG
jgi:hypothetical protein